MKTFKDLEFKQRGDDSGYDTQAEMEFKNGYGVSVITGKAAYSSLSMPYEMAILYKGAITYSSGITDDVIGYLTEKRVTDYMEKVQLLNS